MTLRAWFDGGLKGVVNPWTAVGVAVDNKKARRISPTGLDVHDLALKQREAR
jgi:hypothetical protein